MGSFVNPDASNRFVVFFTLLVNYILLVCYRVILFRIKKHGALDVRHVAVIGAGPAAYDFARTIENHREWGLKLIGVFDRSEVRTVLEGGGVDELIVVAERESLDEFSEIVPDVRRTRRNRAHCSEFLSSFHCPDGIARVGRLSAAVLQHHADE